MRGESGDDTVQDLSKTGLRGIDAGGSGHAASRTDEMVGGVELRTLHADEARTGAGAT